jgi:hypothetical protein
MKVPSYRGIDSCLCRRRPPDHSLVLSDVLRRLIRR